MPSSEDVLTAVMDIRERVVRIETKLERNEELEKRVANLEKMNERRMGAGAMIKVSWAVATVIISILVSVGARVVFG